MAVRLAHRPQQSGAEAGDQHIGAAGPAAAAADDVHRGLGQHAPEAADRLELDIGAEPEPGEEIERLAEFGHRLAGEGGVEPAARIEGAKLVQTLARDAGLAAADALDGDIVDDDAAPVPAEAHVEFDPARAGGVGGAEAGQGILRREAGGAAMADDRWQRDHDVGTAPVPPSPAVGGRAVRPSSPPLPAPFAGRRRRPWTTGPRRSPDRRFSC